MNPKHKGLNQVQQTDSEKLEKGREWIWNILFLNELVEDKESVRKELS